ncbi:PilZ domain-containing protein [Pelovirga terrestris]|uniref:PilZ domain-containing protein n=1 Tax=Pelovirga terrestris TaxID=2771352 RepID=A0A8J6QQJ6_9BACT|nr:PilZ domain-containing protein [Pelovirga terrestris]MBD1401276.1 PilZ domain-containing protein [Pelovirga terrestris]
MSILDHLDDYRVVKITLPIEGGAVAQLDAVARVTNAPQFEVIFLKGQLKEQALDPTVLCRLAFDVAGAIKSIQARIDHQPAADKLVLELVESFSYLQKREYFRVDAELVISWWRVEDEDAALNTVQSMANISGGGVRFPVAEKVERGERIGMNILLHVDKPVIECVGEVVGSYLLGRDHSLALKFIAIEHDDRDEIVAFCLAEQRRQLRLKVQVLDSL